MLRFLALGDSYTIGEAVDPADRWPVQLVARLRERSVDIDDPEIIATTGWTTDELDAGIDEAAPRGPYDLVSLLIGVNNQYRGRTEAEYRAQFRRLLVRAVGFAAGGAGRVLVLSIPDWSVTPFARESGRSDAGDAIDRFNAIARAEAELAGAAWLDVTPSSRRAADDPALIAGDGLHPVGATYTEWAELALPIALAMLTASPG